MRVLKFRGIDRYSSAIKVTPDYALDLLNVICSNNGGMEKMRVPTALTPQIGSLAGPRVFFDYQKADGFTRQIITFEGTKIFALDAAAGYAPVQVDDNPLNDGLWSCVESNNLLFMANGKRMLKWNGTAIQPWGIQTPVVAPSVNPGAGPVAILAAPNGLLMASGAIQAGPNGLTQVGFVVTVKFTALVDFPIQAGDTLVIAGAGDPAYDGTFILASAAVVGGKTVVTFVHTVSGLAASGAGTGSFNLAAVFTAVGMTFINGQVVTVAGAGIAGYNGTWTLRFIAFSGSTVAVLVLNTTGLAASGNGTIASGLTLVSGRKWRYAYRCSLTGHVGTASDASASSGPLASQLPLVTATPPAPVDGLVDTQIDQIRWTCTLDGGSDYFYNRDTTIATDGYTLQDGTPDTGLTLSLRAQLINNPPPVGNYLAVYQGRIFVFCLAGAGHDIAYSGYERILDGRPEESYPPNNRLRLAIGSDVIAGGGVIQAGVIAFSKSNEMYMLRGIMEDVTISAPILFTAFLEQLPWNQGSASHDTIQSTSYGLLFQGSDLTIQLFNGTNKPITISDPVNSILSTITPGYSSVSRSTYFSYVDRDWYVLLIPTAGSATPNKILFFDLTENPETNAGIFVSDIPADDVEVVEKPDGTRMLCLSSGGYIYQFKALSDAVNAISPITYTSGTLQAYWRSGYFGAESPELQKLFRWARLIADQSGFQVRYYVVDHEQYTFRNPLVVGPFNVDQSNLLSMNLKGKALSIELIFPSADVTAGVMALVTNVKNLSVR
jgi:hypothetical protein